MTDRYSLSTERSRFTVQAFAGGILSGFAHNPIFAIRRFSGEARFEPGGPNLWCQITVEAKSLSLTGTVKEKDRQEIERAMFDEVLEVGRFPQIIFTSTESEVAKIADDWCRAQLRGDMQLHGMKKTQQIDLQARITDGELRLSGEFPLSLSAYKMKRVTALGGMIQLKDELKFTLDLVGIKQEPAQ
jgi:polyisoprenoid-binding protein YceI